MNVLVVNHVTVRFGDLVAVRDLSFKVKQREIVGIAGPNGAGKTTLFNAIFGSCRYSGDIYLDGQKISQLKPHQICQKGVGRTFQIPQLFSSLSVIDNIRVGAHFGAQLRGANNEEEQIKEVISLLGMQAKESVLAANLNLFDKKRVMIAIAMATRPKLLLIDEPVGGLSPTETKEIMALIRKVNKELDLSIIIIEHLMKVLTALSNHLIIMDNGEKIDEGPPKSVIKNEEVIRVYLGRSKHA